MTQCHVFIRGMIIAHMCEDFGCTLGNEEIIKQ